MSYSFSPKIITDGLVLYLDAANPKSYIGSGTSWNDLSRETNNGTLINGPTFNPNNLGSIVFDGVNDYVNIPHSSIFNTQSFTLNIWVKFSSFGNFNSLITNPQNGTISSPWFNPYLSWMLRVISDNGVEVGIGSNSVYYNSNFSYNFTTNQIYNIVATYDGLTIIVYVNSINIGQNSVSTTINYTSKPVIIGSDYGLGFSNCSIYNTQVYNKALTDSEVLQNYNALKGRFGKQPENIVTDQLILNLDAGNPTSYSGSGSVWYDLSGNGYDADLINSPSFNPSNEGSIVFDGINDYGRITYNPNFNLSSTDYTLEGWFNSNSFSNSQILISKDTNGSNFDWCLYIPNSMSLAIYSNGTSTNVTAIVPTMSTGQWYHFVVTSISGVIRIYLNSVLYQTQSMSTSNSSQVYVTLGCASWNVPNGFTNGKISILRTYRKGLNDSEVLQNYNAIKGRYNL